MQVVKILNDNYIPAMKWSDRNRTSIYDIKRKIRKLLFCLSGDDLIPMLEDVLEINEKKELSKKYIEALKGISQAVNNTSIIKQKNKHHFIRPLRKSGLSYVQAKELGFDFFGLLWKSCLNEEERNLGGRPSVGQNIASEIEKHMENLSNIAANRLVKVRTFSERNPCVKFTKKKLSDNYKNALYRQTTLYEAYKNFINQNENLKGKIGFATFYKYVDNRFKKPSKSTDLCDYCEYGKEIIKELKSYIEANNHYFDQEWNAENLSIFFNQLDQSSSEISENLKKIDDLKSIEHHKLIAQKQRTAYNRDRLDPNYLNDKIVIDIDFKQKIVLGSSPRQLNSEFYEAGTKKAICLGFGINFADERNGSKFVNCLNIDVISDYEGETASDLIRIFRHVMNLEEFKKVEQKNFIIWVDCGRQFRSSEFIYFCFNELAEKGFNVNLNYFGEKHGKNMRDQHFSVVSRAIQKSIFKNQTSLNNAKDVVTALNTSELFLSENNNEKDKPRSKSIAVLFNPPEKEVVLQKKRLISDINKYYNFQNVNQDGKIEFLSSIYSDQQLNLITVDSKIEESRFIFENKIKPKQNENERFSIKRRKELIRSIEKKKKFKTCENSNLNLKSNDHNLNQEENQKNNQTESTLKRRKELIQNIEKRKKLKTIEKPILNLKNNDLFNLNQEENQKNDQSKSTLKRCNELTQSIEKSNLNSKNDDQYMNQEIKQKDSIQTESKTDHHTSSAPIFCIYNCKECLSEPKYSIVDIMRKEFLSQKKISDELGAHGHKKSLKMKNNKFRNLKQGKDELINHYRYYHGYE